MSGRSHGSLPVPRRWCLLVGIWLVRLGFVWLLAYPVLRVLSNSPMLHGAGADRDLFQPGGETLLALLAARSTSLADLDAALWLLGAVAGVLAVASSSLSWIAIDESLPFFGKRLQRRWCRVLPAFVLTTIGSVGCTMALGWCWWQLFPVIGALLEPWLGERGTDSVQLCVLLCLGCAFATVFTLSDLVRAALASGRSSLRSALPIAVELYLSQPLRITSHAWLRFILALSLHIAHGWVLAHYQWLARSGWFAALAVAQGEAVTLVAIGLRLDWIAWITRTQARLSSRVPSRYATARVPNANLG
jgi:hypothetical protein